VVAAREIRSVEVSGREVGISSPDKIYFPDLGATKLDLVNYYLAVGQPLLGAVAGRPAMLQRFPEGAAGKSFFQKRVPAGAPDWLETTVVATPNGTTSNALVVADVAHVLWAVNLGCLGLHVWPYRAADPDHADELRIDLDPQPGVGFDEVRRAAGHTRALLEELGMAGFPKTSGNRGLHVYVRLEPRWDPYEVRRAAVAVARRSASPSARRSKATNEAGVSAASRLMREAAGWMRWDRASKSRPDGPATTISPSSTHRAGSWSTRAATSSGK
jgi:DNA ligase D-like protein (predicted polymerase)